MESCTPCSPSSTSFGRPTINTVFKKVYVKELGISASILSNRQLGGSFCKLDLDRAREGLAHGHSWLQHLPSHSAIANATIRVLRLNVDENSSPKSEMRSQYRPIS